MTAHVLLRLLGTTLYLLFLFVARKNIQQMPQATRKRAMRAYWPFGFGLTILLIIVPWLTL